MSERFRKEVDRMHGRLSSVLEPTPLQFNQYLSDRFGARIFLKREDLSPVRSYKIRGAYAFLMDALDADPAQKLFVCASAGNHAQGFAHAVRHYKKKGVIFMPVTTPQQKIMKTTSFGAPHVEIRLVGDSFDEANRAAYDFCKTEGGLMVPPFDDPGIIRGQATVGKEIADQLENLTGMEHVDLLIMPVGGGGLSSGVTRYLESRFAASELPEFVLVEPDGAPSLKRSLEAGERITLEEMDTFVDGAAVARIGKNNFTQLRKFDPERNVLLAPTNGLCGTILEMLNVEGIVLEPAGALAVDALKRLPYEKVAGSTIVCVTSGGNFDFERLPEVKERAMKFQGLKKYFILRFPQRPGALKDFLFLLGPEDDIARFEYLKKSARNFGSVLIGIETTKAENFDRLRKKLDHAGMHYQDITDNEIIGNLVL